MEPVEGVDLAQTTKDAEAELQAERQRSVAGFIKELLKQAAHVRKAIEALEWKLAKRKEHLDRIEGKVRRLRAGDWKALPDPQKGDGQEPKEAG